MDPGGTRQAHGALGGAEARRRAPAGAFAPPSEAIAQVTGPLVPGDARR
ncbi:hypothetical protein [Streptomyces sp. DH37]|nr:hypothetical protein [Streptomyces sp. DH37]MDG9702030.1 hypothetical protein [Streptomyces sp. DH37]